MPWIKWRERLAYYAMSAFVAWHSLAIIIAPMPDSSTLVQSIRGVLQPYLSIFRLDNRWNFFAPVGRHTQFRYIVEDAAGKRHVFIPVEEASGSISHYVTWRERKYFFEGVTEAPNLRLEKITTLLCQKHASLKPVSISFILLSESEFTPEHYRNGHRPLEPEFVTVNELSTIKC